MEQSPARITCGTLAGLLVFALVLAMIAWPLALWISGSGRWVVVRLAVAVLCAAILLRLLTIVRAEAGIDEVSEADLALQSRTLAPQPDPLLFRLAGDARTGLTWKVVPMALQDRLQKMIARRFEPPPTDLTPLPSRRLTWRQAEAIVSKLEERT